MNSVNWARASITVGGTGNLTIGSVDGFPTFAQTIAVDTTIPYAILDENFKPLELGVGKITDATTFVRETVYETFVGGVFDNTSPAAINVGTTNVLVSPLISQLFTEFGFSVIAAVNASALRTLLGLGSAALASTSSFATAAQGALADSALQAEDIGSLVQGFDQQLADVAGLTPTANNVIIGNGTNLVMSAVKTINSNSILGSGNIQVAGITSGTAVTLTTQTTVDFTGIPSGVSRVTMLFSLVSGNTAGATHAPIVQIGDSGGIEATGYTSAGGVLTGTNTCATASATTGILMYNTGILTGVVSGMIILGLVDNSTNTWAFSTATSSVSEGFIGGGNKSLSATLDRVRLTTVAGTAQFDAGKVQIFYE